MGVHGFVLTLAVAAALLALWCHVRWPGAAPAGYLAAALRVIAGLLLLHVGVLVLEAAVGTSPGMALLAIVGVIVPVLTFMFLASLWVLKVFADSLRGYR
jgi:hypothetical protein